MKGVLAVVEKAFIDLPKVRRNALEGLPYSERRRFSGYAGRFTGSRGNEMGQRTYRQSRARIPTVMAVLIYNDRHRLSAGNYGRNRVNRFSYAATSAIASKYLARTMHALWVLSVRGTRLICILNLIQSCSNFLKSGFLIFPRQP